MKRIPESFELDESDIMTALHLYLKSLGKGDEFTITLHTENKQSPMGGGMSGYSERVIVSATASKK